MTDRRQWKVGDLAICRSKLVRLDEEILTPTYGWRVRVVSNGSIFFTLRGALSDAHPLIDLADAGD